MTEAEWLACEEPRPMLEWLQRRPRVRRLRLFACAYCRRVAHLVGDAASLDALDVAEQYADGVISETRFAAARAAAHEAAKAQARLGGEVRLHVAIACWAATGAEAIQAAKFVAFKVEDAVRAGERSGRVWKADDLQKILRGQSATLRDIFGNPFRPAAFAPALRTTAVTALAQAAYEERIMPAGTLEPDRLAVLSDALEDAGCTDADLLDHLRSPVPHVRGCWALDLVLGCPTYP